MSTHRLNRTFLGYTLIEVLIVVVIIGIAGVIVVPQMLQPGRMQIQAAGRMIVSDLFYAQSDAMSRQTARRVVFDTTNDNYRITDGAGTVIPAAWQAGSTFVVDFQRDSRFSGVSIDSVDFGGTNTIEYDDQGAPSTGGTVDLTASGDRYRITVAPFTGRVTIAPVVAGTS